MLLTSNFKQTPLLTLFSLIDVSLSDRLWWLCCCADTTAFRTGSHAWYLNDDRKIKEITEDQVVVRYSSLLDRYAACVKNVLFWYVHMHQAALIHDCVLNRLQLDRDRYGVG